MSNSPAQVRLPCTSPLLWFPTGPCSVRGSPANLGGSKRLSLLGGKITKSLGRKAEYVGDAKDARSTIVPRPQQSYSTAATSPSLVLRWLLCDGQGQPHDVSACLRSYTDLILLRQKSELLPGKNLPVERREQRVVPYLLCLFACCCCCGCSLMRWVSCCRAARAGHDGLLPPLLLLRARLLQLLVAAAKADVCR